MGEEIEMRGGIAKGWGARNTQHAPAFARHSPKFNLSPLEGGRLRGGSAQRACAGGRVDDRGPLQPPLRALATSHPPPNLPLREAFEKSFLAAAGLVLTR